MNYTFYLFLTITTLCLVSCSSGMIEYSGKKTSEMKSAAIISTFIGKAQTYDQQYLVTANLSRAIMEMQKGRVDSCRMHIALGFEKLLNCKTLYGETLHNRPEFIELKKSFDYPKGLETGDPDYPCIVAASNDISPFKFEVKEIPNVFSPEGFQLQAMSDIAKALDVDVVVVSYSHLYFSTIPKIVEFFYRSFQLKTTLYLFNKDGEHILTLTNQSITKSVNISDYSAYAQIFDEYEKVINEALKEIDLKEIISNK